MPGTNRLWKLYGFIAFLFIVIVAAGWWFSQTEPEPEPVPDVVEEVLVPEPTITEKVIGSSVEGRDISATTFANPGLSSSTTKLLLVGGMHGGYEWNSSLLAYQMIDHLSANLAEVPTGFIVTIIPDINPDGTALVTGKTGRFSLADIPDPSTRVAEARFNANGIDLNRNFDCKWAPESSWKGETVSAGTGPFSEPEAAALRDFVTEYQPEAVIFWHSQANNVYASECESGVLPETLTLMSTYAKPAGYGEVPVFDAYPITGDAEGWLASIGIPAITVELGTFNSTEWAQNLAGFNATLKNYAK